MSTTTDSSVFCNTKVAMGLRELFAFTHHERLLLWDPGWSLFYKPSVTTESADTKLHWQGEGLLSKQTDILAGFLVFHVFLHLLFIICLTHVHSVSFRFIIIWTCLFWFLCMCGFPGLSLTSGENFPSIAPLKIYLLKKKEKNVDMFNTYFHYMLHLMPPPPKKKGWNSCVETGEKSSFIHFLNCSSSWGWCRAAACSSCHWARMDRLPVFSRVNLTANYVH